MLVSECFFVKQWRIPVLTEAVFEVGCNAGVIFVTFLDYVQMPHNTLARQDFPRFARDKLT